MNKTCQCFHLIGFSKVLIKLWSILGSLPTSLWWYYRGQEWVAVMNGCSYLMATSLRFQCLIWLLKLLYFVWMGVTMLKVKYPLSFSWFISLLFECIWMMPKVTYFLLRDHLAHKPWTWFALWLFFSPCYFICTT